MESKLDKARLLHEQAQFTGSAEDYEEAAKIYEREGYGHAAEQCRKAAALLRPWSADEILEREG